MILAVSQTEQLSIFCVMMHRNRCAITTNRILWEMVHPYQLLTEGVLLVVVGNPGFRTDEEVATVLPDVVAEAHFRFEDE